MHRAKDLQGNEVKGYWCKVQGTHYMIPEDAIIYRCGRLCDAYIYGSVEIDPATLAMDTTVKDEDDKPIYGSFEYEEGKMSDGGDMVRGI